MRQTTLDNSVFNSTITNITAIVKLVTQTSSSSLISTPFFESSQPIIVDLERTGDEISKFGGMLAATPESKTMKQKLATSSYGIAKHVKDLISLLD